ncbi:LacI family transcriptional regulator [Isoptericola jiangsuensis]|uniref:LacI family transcriptional regulator n=1 Tax=Isoptericola jiangsuensis TaxID=548579 RepID=A0A2A9F067_9MICO|nr:LacI family DNA-binding transcriptional regulator [Isoptericola jiangsuensis]PFG44538.1 LacI family transcriptional regulator [Isoptericola jiangsuensis]
MSANRAPTLEDVARVAGVSRATVSRVVNQERRVAPAIQEKVHAAITATGYVPNRAARSLVTRRSGAVAVVVAGSAPDDGPDRVAEMLADPFFGRVAGGAVRALRPRDVHPVLMLADDADARRQVLGFVGGGHVDGALLVSTDGNDPLAAALHATGRPLVVFARPPEDLPVSWVDVANADGGALAAGRLLDRGRRRLGVLGVAPELAVHAADQRTAGFTAAAEQGGAHVVTEASGEFTVASGAAAAARLLDRAPDLDGLFAANDLMALGALQVLHARGLRVPDDVAVVGFDDSPVASISAPALTTVRQPVEAMARAMAEMLLRAVDGDDTAPRSEVFAPALVVRASA